jgi:hypothetical protein
MEYEYDGPLTDPSEEEEEDSDSETEYASDTDTDEDEDGVRRHNAALPSDEIGFEDEEEFLYVPDRPREQPQHQLQNALQNPVRVQQEIVADLAEGFFPPAEAHELKAAQNVVARMQHDGGLPELALEQKQQVEPIANAFISNLFKAAKESSSLSVQTQHMGRLTSIFKAMMNSMLPGVSRSLHDMSGSDFMKALGEIQQSMGAGFQQRPKQKRKEVLMLEDAMGEPDNEIIEVLSPAVMQQNANAQLVLKASNKNQLVEKAVAQAHETMTGKGITKVIRGFINSLMSIVRKKQPTQVVTERALVLYVEKQKPIWDAAFINLVSRFSYVLVLLILTNSNQGGGFNGFGAIQDGKGSTGAGGYHSKPLAFPNGFRINISMPVSLCVFVRVCLCVGF